MPRHNDKKIHDVIQDVLAGNKKLASGMYSAQISEIWRREMGPVIGRYTRAIELNGGVLKVVVDSAPLRRELLSGKIKIIEMVNAAIGKEVVTDVVVL
jgi:predicted nucleic acid-binding Zn ribbon protein